jgi:hypothetical protein
MRGRGKARARMRWADAAGATPPRPPRAAPAGVNSRSRFSSERSWRAARATHKEHFTRDLLAFVKS